MNKKLISLMLSASMAVGLTACGQATSQSTGSKAGGNSSGGVTEITFPTFLAGENVGAKFFLPEVERFNKKYEGKYKINIEEVPQASYAEKIKQLAQQNKLPAIVHSPGSGGIDVQWFKNIVLKNNMAYDLKSFIDSHPKTKANYVPESLDFCTVDGKVICKPISVLKPVGLYYNNTMYKSDKSIKDQTMDEFINGLGSNKIAFQTAENAWTTGLFLTALIGNESGGAELLQKAADDKLYDYTDSSIVKAVGILQKVLQKNASSNTVGAAYADAANAFMSKSASIIFNGSWMTGDFASNASDKWSNGFTGDQVNSSIYPGNIAIANPSIYGEFWISNSATDKEKELAEAFFEFRDSQEEIEALILAEGGSAPSITYSQDFLNKQKENRILSELSDSMDKNTKYVVSIFDVMPSSVADTEFGKLLPKLIDNTLTPEQFCQQLTEKAQEAKS